MSQRSHEQIIKDAAGGDTATEFAALAAKIGAKPHQPRDWAARDSVPPEWWGVLVEAALTTLEEMQRAAEAKRLPEIAQRRGHGPAAQAGEAA